MRTIGYGAAALLCGILAQHLEHPWLFALRVGLVTGFVTGVGIVINPYIEYYADHLPERTLGALGIGLILCGFACSHFSIGWRCWTCVSLRRTDGDIVIGRVRVNYSKIKFVDIRRLHGPGFSVSRVSL